MDKRTYRLPKAVYYQCMWTVKDYDRLKRLSMAEDVGFGENELVFSELDEDVVVNREVLKQAKFKLRCIRMALEQVPEEYRQGTLDSIVYDLDYSSMAHENTWRKWRRVFIRNLASRLCLV